MEEERPKYKILCSGIRFHGKRLHEDINKEIHYEHISIGGRENNLCIDEEAIKYDSTKPRTIEEISKR